MTYGYDAYSAGANYGRGKRTSMTDGSGSTTWLYGDVRGRLTKETKTITGGGSFVTEWAYDAADLPTWMRYPDGEQVTTSYLRQKLVNGVSGSSLYVQSTQYDAAGRLELRALGSDQVRIDPHYRPWTTQGGACTGWWAAWRAAVHICRRWSTPTMRRATWCASWTR